MTAEVERSPVADGPARVLVEPLERGVLDGVRELEGEARRIRVDLGLVPVFADERPLVGLGGLIDWRSSGRLSALIRRGLWTGARGEQLLTLGDRRLPVERLVLLGLGERAAFDAQAARAAAERLVETAVQLQAEGVLIALPSQWIERAVAEALFESLIAAVEAALARPTEPTPPESVESIADGPSGDETGEDPRREAADQPAGADQPDQPDQADQADQADQPDQPDQPQQAEVGAEGASDPAAERASKPAGAREAADEVAEQAAEGGSEEAAHGQAEEGEAGEEPSAESAPAPADPPEVDPAQSSPSRPRAPVRWWVVADEAVVNRLRRVLSGPPRPAAGGAGLHT